MDEDRATWQSSRSGTAGWALEEKIDARQSEHGQESISLAAFGEDSQASSRVSSKGRSFMPHHSTTVYHHAERRTRSSVSGPPGHDSHANRAPAHSGGVPRSRASVSTTSDGAAVPAYLPRRGSSSRLTGEPTHLPAVTAPPEEERKTAVPQMVNLRNFTSLASLLSAQIGVGQRQSARPSSRFGVPASTRRWQLVLEATRNIRLYKAKDRLRELAFFQRLQPPVRVQLLKAVYYAKMGKGVPLYFQGAVAGVDDPGNLYILIHGEVAVQMTENESEGLDFNVDHDQDHSKSKHWGNVVATIQPGALLGHISLLSKQPRNATCVCSADSEFLVLRKRDFDKVLRSSLEAIADESAEFLLQHVPGLKRLPRVKADHVMHNFQRTFFDRSHVFVRQGDPHQEEAIFVIVRGSVEVIKGDHKVGMLVAGAIFGTGLPGVPEDFTIAVDNHHSCEVFQVRGSALLNLPPSMRGEINKHIVQMREWHWYREEEHETMATHVQQLVAMGELPDIRPQTETSGRVSTMQSPAFLRMGSMAAPLRKPRTRPARVTDPNYCEFPGSKSASRLGTQLTCSLRPAASGQDATSSWPAGRMQPDSKNNARMASWQLPMVGSRDQLLGLPQVTPTPHKASKATLSEARTVLKKLRNI